MQTQNKIFDDLAKVANGAVSTLVGMKDEIDTMIRQRLERFLTEADLVPRDEFDAVKEMASNARAENDKLAARIDELEAKLENALKPAPARKKATTRKLAAGKPATRKAKTSS